MHLSVTVSVECRPDDRGEEVPCVFIVGARRIEVVDVLDCWPGRDHRYFKVRSSEGGLYIMRHDTPSGQWEIALFELR